MSYSDVDICNFALGRIGIDRTIGSLTENSKEARNCNRFYPLARDEVLERVVWPGLVKIVALSPLDVDADLMPGWGYQYALPSDVASIGAVVPAGEITDAAASVRDCCGPWQPGRFGRYAFRKALSSDGTRMAILSNIEDAYAVYSSKTTNPELFSTLMVSVIADRLAMELAMPMTADPRWFQVAQQRYTASFIDATSREFEQERPGPEADPPSIRARG